MAGHTPGNIKENSSGKRKITSEDLYLYREMKITRNNKYVGIRLFKEKTLTMFCGIYNM